MEKHLIITADDMGYNTERNQGIVDCFERKGVTNSSLMVNGVACEHAASLALKHGLPTGLHFNISEGVPVQADSQYSTLTDKQGHFLGMHNLRDAVTKGTVDKNEVREELRRQIARYVELMGDKPVYIDGHQHAHMLPGLAATFAQTLEEHGVRATRCAYELDLESATWVGPPWNKFFYEVSSDADLARPVLAAHNVWASDAFYGLMTMGRNMTVQRLQAGILRAFEHLSKSALKKNRPVTCELMTHPGYACQGPGGCGVGPDDFSESPDREYEKTILESQEMQSFYKVNGITLVSMRTSWLELLQSQ